VLVFPTDEDRQRHDDDQVCCDGSQDLHEISMDQNSRAKKSALVIEPKYRLRLETQTDVSCTKLGDGVVAYSRAQLLRSGTPPLQIRQWVAGPCCTVHPQREYESTLTCPDATTESPLACTATGGPVLFFSSLIPYADQNERAHAPLLSRRHHLLGIPDTAALSRFRGRHR
jgi:hypothetical protein